MTRLNEDRLEEAENVLARCINRTPGDRYELTEVVAAAAILLAHKLGHELAGISWQLEHWEH